MILPFSTFSPSHKYYKILWMAIVAFNVIFTIFEDVLEKKADSIFWGKLFCNLIRIHIYFTFFQIWKHWECWIVFYLNKSLLPNRSSSKPTNPNPNSYMVSSPLHSFLTTLDSSFMGRQLQNPLGLLPSLLPSSSNDPYFCHWVSKSGPPVYMYIGKSILKLGREHDSAGGQATNVVHNICYLANSQKEGGHLPLTRALPPCLLLLMMEQICHLGRKRAAGYYSAIRYKC